MKNTRLYDFISEFDDQQVEDWVDSSEEFISKIEDCIHENEAICHSVKLTFLESIDNPEEKEHVVEFSGGLNGRGDWEEYLKCILSLTSSLKKKFSNVRLAQEETDLLDDIFYIVFILAE